jgi:hypothetical protein
MTMANKAIHIRYRSGGLTTQLWCPLGKTSPKPTKYIFLDRTMSSHLEEPRPNALSWPRCGPDVAVYDGMKSIDNTITGLP